jgi:hypothetical protein
MDARRIAVTGLVALAATVTPVAAPAMADSGSAAGSPPAPSGPIVRGTFVSKTESGHGATASLPFTGYDDWLIAVVGLGMAGTGIGLRRRLN